MSQQRFKIGDHASFDADRTILVRIAEVLPLDEDGETQYRLADNRLAFDEELFDVHPDSAPQFPTPTEER